MIRTPSCTLEYVFSHHSIKKLAKVIYQTEKLAKFVFGNDGYFCIWFYVT